MHPLMTLASMMALTGMVSNEPYIKYFQPIKPTLKESNPNEWKKKKAQKQARKRQN